MNIFELYNDSSFFQIDIDNIETPDYKIDLDYYNNLVVVDTNENIEKEIRYTPTKSWELCCISKKYFENANEDEELGKIIIFYIGILMRKIDKTSEKIHCK